MRLIQDSGCVEIGATVATDDEIAQGLCFDAGLTDALMRLEKHLRS
jgi:hypothetical protein